MNTLLGILFILAGIGLGAYVGIWLMFIGGIVGVIAACRATTIVPMDIAINVAKILFSGLVGQLVFWFCTLIGKAFLEN